MKIPRNLKYAPLGPDSTSLFTGRRGPAGPGWSKPPYDSFNLAFNIGDDPVAVAANRSQLARLVGIAPTNLIFMSQVHGTTVAHVTGPRPDAVPGTDAMVTATPDLALAVMVADCVPLLLRDPAAGVVGVAHAGRLGAAAGIAPAVIAAMIDLGARPESLEVLVGPAICGRCYEVPAEMRDEVESRLSGSACLTSWGTPGLDLRAGIVAQLRELAVGIIEVDDRCTREDPDLFSHRRSAPTGRFAGVIRQ